MDIQIKATITFDVTSIVIEGKERKITTEADLREVHDYLSKMVQLCDIANRSNAVQAPRPVGEVLQVRRPVMDYAIDAAKMIGSPFTVGELTGEMLRAGWQTKSKERANLDANVRTCLTNHPKVFRHEPDARWSLIGAGNEQPPPVSGLECRIDPRFLPGQTTDAEMHDNLMHGKGA